MRLQREASMQAFPSQGKVTRDKLSLTLDLAGSLETRHSQGSAPTCLKVLWRLPGTIYELTRYGLMLPSLRAMGLQYACV